MKRINDFRVVTLFFGIFCFTGLDCRAQDLSAAFSSLDDSHAALVIGDLKGLIDGAVQVADQVMPGMGATLPAQVGGFLDDPELAGFAPGAGIAAIAFPGDLIVIFAEVEESQREAYKKSVEKFGIQSETVGDLMVLYREEAGLETGKKIAGEVQDTLLGGKGRASLDAYLHVPKILGTYKEQIDAGLESFPKMMEAGFAESASAPTGATGMANLLQAEVHAIYSLISQLDVFEVELTPGEEGVSLEISLMPLKETNLSRLLTESKGGDAGELIKMIPTDGAFRSEAAYDVQAFQTFTMAEMDHVFDTFEWTAEEKENMKKWVQDSMKIYGSGFAGALFGDSETFFNGAMIYQVEDPEGALKLFREMTTNMDSLGILDLYKKMGMEMKFDYKEKVKEHKGIPIHRLEMTFDLEGLEGNEMEAFMKSFSHLTYDLAIVEGYLVHTMGGVPIEGVIDSVLAGGAPEARSLVSKEKLGEGGSFYLDLDLAGYLRMISNVMKGVPDEGEGKSEEARAKLDESIAALSGAPPILTGLFADTERATFEIQVPMGLLQKGSEAATGAMAPKEN